MKNSKQAQHSQQIIEGKVRREAPLHADLRELLRYCVATFPEQPAYRFHEEAKGKTVTRTYRDLYHDIRVLGTALMDPTYTIPSDFFDSDEPHALRRRRIAIYGENSYSWILAANSTLFSGDITVPLDRQIPVNEAISLLKRSKTSILFLDETNKELLDALLLEPLSLKHIVLMQAHPFFQKKSSDPQVPTANTHPTITLHSMQSLYEEGLQLPKSQFDAFDSKTIDPHAVCSICFTSGTTAASKGVMITQQNVTANVRMVNESIKITPRKNLLSILPLHHTFENAAHYSFWATGACLYINDGLRNFASNLKDWDIEIMVAVPLLFERIYKKIMMEAERNGKLKTLQRLIRLTNFLRRIKIDIRKPLYRNVRAKFAPTLETVILGAAPIRPEVQDFFTDIGIDNFLGYGMTECSPLISNNSQWAHARGSVGQPCARVRVRIDVDPGSDIGEGEVQVQSPGVMKGYYADEVSTKQAFTEDGWLRTGDIGRFDENNCLYITGRLKSMIVLKNGKKAFPEEIESLISDLEGVTGKIAFASETLEGDSEIALLLQINENISNDTDFMQKLKMQISEAVEHANQIMPPYKAIRYWAWTTSPFTMTTTLKIKRKETIERLQNYLQKENLVLRDIHKGDRLLPLF